MSLRDYQVLGKNMIRAEFMKGKKSVILWMATGGGKTATFCDMIKEVDNRGKKAVMLVRGRKLVDQASKRLFREGVQHGVFMAGHWNFRPQYRVQACSIDTLISREAMPPADLVIVDEVHLFGPDSQASNIVNRYREQGAFIVGVTATPYCPTGLRHLADVMVKPITMQELIDRGFLVPFRIFAPSKPDLSGLKLSLTSNGYDYSSKQLEGRMVAGQLTGKIIEHWQKVASDRPTLGFAVNINHSKFMVEKFNQAGITAEHCDADTPEKEREEIIKRLEQGITKVVWNVGIFCTGVDIPSLGAIIMARPTKSRNLFIQQAGRGTRPFTNKFDCILLDHADNVRKHGFPTLEPDVDLDGNESSSEKHIMETKICKSCFAAYRGTHCPLCGEEAPKPKKEIVETDEKLEEIKVTAQSPIEQWLMYLDQQRKKFGYKPGWQYWKLLDKFKYEECEHLFPKWFKDRHAKKLDVESDPFSNSPFNRRGE